MRECFSLFLWNKRDPQTKELRLRYLWKIKFNKYYDGTLIWKMVLNDTLLDLKRKLR